jgi:hypothetical protein
MKQKEKEEYFAGAALNGTGRHSRWIRSISSRVSSSDLYPDDFYLTTAGDLTHREIIYTEGYPGPSRRLNPTPPPHTHSDAHMSLKHVFRH